MTPVLMSAGQIVSMEYSHMDIEDYAKDFKHPYLILLADKDKIVDNSGAIDFHKKTGTPSDLKDLKQFYNCYH